MRGISANQIDLTCFTGLREVLVLRCFPRIPVVTSFLPPPSPPSLVGRRRLFCDEIMLVSYRWIQFSNEILLS